MCTPVILASASEIRASMLQNAGVLVELSPARVDERAVKDAMLADGHAPRNIADALAELKAAKVSARYPDRFVIGCDQVMEFDGQLLDKPTSLDDARARLLRLRNKTHELHSAVVIFEGSKPVFRHIARARLTMRAFSDTFLDQYLAREAERAMQTVGGYRIEDHGVQLFSRVEGDHFTILGLPLLQTLGYLRTRGVLME